MNEIEIMAAVEIIENVQHRNPARRKLRSVAVIDDPNGFRFHATCLPPAVSSRHLFIKRPRLDAKKSLGYCPDIASKARRAGGLPPRQLASRRKCGHNPLPCWEMGRRSSLPTRHGLPFSRLRRGGPRDIRTIPKTPHEIPPRAQ